MRIILGVIIGFAAGIGLVMAGDAINHRLWPPPPDVQVTNPEAIRDYMATAPVTSLLGLPVTWTFAALAGAFIAAKIAGRTWAGWIAGGALFAATCLNLAFIPHPLWMLIAALVFVPVAAWLGARLAAPRAGA
jgi:hypothetical protein